MQSTHGSSATILILFVVSLTAKSPALRANAALNLCSFLSIGAPRIVGFGESVPMRIFGNFLLSPLAPDHLIETSTALHKEKLRMY